MNNTTANSSLIDVSVIIPIYNTEDYLLHCLCSLVKALGNLHYEVLLMDDGSTDSSSDIAKSFAASHEGFFYHRLVNGGQGKARNKGVDLSSGEYIYFMDSDDYLFPDLIEDLFFSAKTNHADMSMCSAVLSKEGKITFEPNLLRVFSKVGVEQAVTTLRKCPYLAYNSTVTNKLIRRDFYIENGIHFPEGVVYEDTLPSIQLYYCAASISLLRTRGYVYRIRQDQSNTIRRLEYNVFSQKLHALKTLFQYVDNEDDFPVAARMVLEHKALYSDFIFYLNSLSSFGDSATNLVSELADFINSYISQKTLDHLPLAHRQMVMDILDEDIDHLLKTIAYKNSTYSIEPIEKRGLCYYYSSMSDEIIRFPERNVADDFYYSVPISFLRTISSDDYSLL